MPKALPRFGNNYAVPALFLQMFPGWFVGIAFAAIAIGALVPAAIMSIACANLFTRNIYREYCYPNCSPSHESQAAKIASLVVKLGALVFILEVPTTYAIQLQLLGGIWIIQTLPAVLLGLYTRWLNPRALLIGWALGIASGTAMAGASGFKASVYVLHFGSFALALLCGAVIAAAESGRQRGAERGAQRRADAARRHDGGGGLRMNLAAMLFAAAAASAPVMTTSDGGLSHQRLQRRQGHDRHEYPQRTRRERARYFPPDAGKEEPDDNYGAEFEVIGSKNGWLLIRNAESGQYGDGNGKIVFKGPGWISGALVSFTINDSDMRSDPSPNAKVIAKLAGDNGAGGVWGPDSFGVTRVYGCLRRFRGL